MARTGDHDAATLTTVSNGQRWSNREQRAPDPQAAIVLTPEGQRLLQARADWLANGAIPELTHNLDDPDQDGWASGEYGRAVAELAHLTSILGQATSTEELPPERPGVVELGDEVLVEFPSGDTERFLLVHPVEAPLDDLRISVESPLAQVLLGRRVGEWVEVEAPAGRYQCRIVTTGRYPRRTAAGTQPAPGQAGVVTSPSSGPASRNRRGEPS